MSEIYEMNIDEIEKYIIGKKIKDMSLEEIKNFIETQGNTIILNHHIYEKQQLEIERLNNIINELEKWLEEQHQFIIEIPAFTKEISIEHKTMEICYENILDKLQELKGVDKE